MKHSANYLPAKGRDWEKARSVALIRDDYKCKAHTLGLCDEPCQAPKRKLIVHHIKFRIRGGTHELDNLITLCHEHHACIHPHLRFELENPPLELGECEKKELAGWQPKVL